MQQRTDRYFDKNEGKHNYFGYDADFDRTPTKKETSDRIESRQAILSEGHRHEESQRAADG